MPDDSLSASLAICSHRDIERGADEFTPDRCRACFAAVFPPSPPSADPPAPRRLTDAEAQHLATSVVTAPSGEVPSAIGRLAAKVLELLARVPHDALAPQPPPANPPRGEPVWPLVIAEAAENEAPPRLVALMRARDQQGRAKYGVPLSANDGRDTTMDALQEALDLIVYLRKRRAEGRSGYQWWELEVVQIAEGLLVEMEREAALPPASPGSSGEAGKQCETCGHTEGQESANVGPTIDAYCPTCGWMGEVPR